MTKRLSFQERGRIALELRERIYALEGRAEVLADESLQPHQLAVGIYAFEFFLNRLRDKFRKVLENSVAYNNGWSSRALLADEECPRSLNRLARMSASLLVIAMDEQGGLDEAAQFLKNEQFNGIVPVSFEEFRAFVCEVLYELAFESSRELLAARGGV